MPPLSSDDDADADAEDVRLAKDGDVDAFGRLFDRHHDRVDGLLYRAAPFETDRADVVQGAFIKGAQGICSLRGDFRPWINRIAINLLRDHQRSDLRRSRREASYVALNQPEDARAELEGVVEAVAALPSQLAEVVSLAYFEGHTQAEIAEMVDCPEGTVAWRISEAKKALQRSLRNHAH